MKLDDTYLDLEAMDLLLIITSSPCFFYGLDICYLENQVYDSTVRTLQRNFKQATHIHAWCKQDIFSASY
jgi:hypothetical protein